MRRRVSRASYLCGVLRRETGSTLLACAAWTSFKKEQQIGHLILARKSARQPRRQQQQEDGEEEEEETKSVLEIVSYDFDNDLLSEVIHSVIVEDAPESIAVHPGGDGIICSFSNYCKLYKLEKREALELRESDKYLGPLQGIGPQIRLIFSTDGTTLAIGGKDGHLRVFEWPSLKVKFDQHEGCKFLKSLDLSLDGAFLASVPVEGSLCRVWDIEKSMLITTITRSEKGEIFGPCLFSRNGTMPFLFIVVSKAGKGYIGVWEMEQWRKIGLKLFSRELITAFSTRYDGKFLVFGTCVGDAYVIEAKKMTIVEVVKDAHPSAIVDVEVSCNGRALMSVSSDSTTRISKLKSHNEWKDWQLYLLLSSMILASAALFYLFSEYSDGFWNFPLGRKQPAKPPFEAIYGKLTDFD